MRKASAVIPHPHFKGVYPADAGRGLARSRLGIEEDSFLLLLPGSIRPYKNAEALIAAFARLAASDLRLLIAGKADTPARSEEHTSELQSLMRISYAVFCLKKKNT